MEIKKIKRANIINNIKKNLSTEKSTVKQHPTTKIYFNKNNQTTKTFFLQNKLLFYQQKEKNQH